MRTNSLFCSVAKHLLGISGYVHLFIVIKLLAFQVALRGGTLLCIFSIRSRYLAYTGTTLAQHIVSGISPRIYIMVGMLFHLGICTRSPDHGKSRESWPC